MTRVTTIPYSVWWSYVLLLLSSVSRRASSLTADWTVILNQNTMSNEPVWRGSYRGDLQQLHRGLRFCVACSSVFGDLFQPNHS